VVLWRLRATIHDRFRASIPRAGRFESKVGGSCHTKKRGDPKIAPLVDPEMIPRVIDSPSRFPVGESFQSVRPASWPLGDEALGVLASSRPKERAPQS
jgi:hypothetical protein